MSTMEPDEGAQPDDLQADAPRWDRVEEAGAAAFTEVVQAWQSPHIDVELTGPWVPYSFATLGEP